MTTQILGTSNVNRVEKPWIYNIKKTKKSIYVLLGIRKKMSKFASRLSNLNILNYVKNNRITN